MRWLMATTPSLFTLDPYGQTMVKLWHAASARLTAGSESDDVLVQAAGRAVVAWLKQDAATPDPVGPSQFAVGDGCALQIRRGNEPVVCLAPHRRLEGRDGEYVGVAGPAGGDRGLHAPTLAGA